MTPTMLQPNEFVISFDIAESKISLRNPHGGDPEKDGNYILLKKLVTGMVQKTESEQPVTTLEVTQTVPANIKETQLYKDMLEIKAMYDKLDEIAFNGRTGIVPSDNGFYRGIVWVLNRVEAPEKA